MLGTIIGIGGAIGGAIAKNSAKSSQYQENLALMKYQAKLNQKQAYYSTGLAKDLHQLRKFNETHKSRRT